MAWWLFTVPPPTLGSTLLQSADTFNRVRTFWREPIYRNVWALLYEFGDAELASLIAPRALIVEASRGPEVAGPPQAIGDRRNAAAAGRLTTPVLSEVREEFDRAKSFFTELGAGGQLTLVVSGNGQGNPGSEQALSAFLHALGVKPKLGPSGPEPQDQRARFDASARLHRQFDQLVEFTQVCVRRSEAIRRQFWSKADASSVENWQHSTATYKRYLWEEVIGKFPDPTEPLVARTRQIYDEIDWRGYEVVLPVWPEVYAYGILLLPKDLAPGERRPVIVCQHGSEGRPQDLIKPSEYSDWHYYHRYAAALADHGFIVYCPQNLYIGGEKYRSLQRIANPIKRSLFSVMLGQHQRVLDWLAEQSYVDPQRMAFYGLSYGGTSAVRIPPLLDKYALSICSASFNEWIRKVSSYDGYFSTNTTTYVYGEGYEAPEFNLGNTFNNAELANLMAPRPFMVERGHDDDVSLDEWVAYEYAKVRRHYDHLGISDRTSIEFFNGPHTIHGVGTFQFLYHFLNWTDGDCRTNLDLRSVEVEPISVTCGRK